MTSLEFVKATVELLKTPSSLPNDITTTVVSATQKGMSVVANLGADDVWQVGIVRVLSGDAIGKVAVILTNQSNSIVYASPMHSSAIPDVGDQVLITRGPLGNSRIYEWNPATVSNDVNVEGVDKFVFVDSPTSQLTPRNFKGRRELGVNSYTRTHNMVAILMSPHRTGATTVSQHLEYKQDTSVMAEQAAILIRHWKDDCGLDKGYLNGSILVEDRLIVEQPGNNTLFNAAVIQFDVSSSY